MYRYNKVYPGKVLYQYSNGRGYLGDLPAG